MFSSCLGSKNCPWAGTLKQLKAWLSPEIGRPLLPEQGRGWERLGSFHSGFSGLLMLGRSTVASLRPLEKGRLQLSLADFEF